MGYPFNDPRDRAHSICPGAPAIVLLVASVGLGLYGLFTSRARLRSYLAARRGRAVLIVLLALATPVGTAMQSAVGNNVFSTRTLAASWPYLAALGIGPDHGRPAEGAHLRHRVCGRCLRDRGGDDAHEGLPSS